MDWILLKKFRQINIYDQYFFLKFTVKIFWLIKRMNIC